MKDMTEQDLMILASRAAAILEEPVLCDIWQGLEADLTEQMISLTIDDDTRRNLAGQVSALRDVRAALKHIVDAAARAGEVAKQSKRP